MRKNKEHKEKTDPFLRLTSLQIGFSLLFFAAVFAVFQWGGERFAEVREEFSRLTETDLSPTSVNFFDLGSIWEKKEEPSSAETTTVGAEEGNAAAVTEVPTEALLPAVNPGPESLPVTASSPLVRMTAFEAEPTAVLPVSGTITSGYGERVHPVYGGLGFHSGVDLAASEGTPVHAALNGTVIDVGVGESSGNYVKVGHSDGKETLYCHLSSVNVKKGVAVRKGDVIGFVGHTGLATGPHLHFELKVDGKKVDPTSFLESAADVFSDR